MPLALGCRSDQFRIHHFVRARQLVLLTIAILSSCGGLVDGVFADPHHVGEHRRPTLIPSCLKMLEKVPELQVSTLRDAAQVSAIV